MNKNWNAAIALTSILSASALLSACGKAPDANPAIGNTPATTTSLPGTACPAGQFPLPYGCAPAADLTQACLIAQGQMILSQGKNLCRMNFGLNLSPTFDPYFGVILQPYGAAFPRLNPTQLASSQAADTGISVFPNDELFYSGYGGWGGPEVSTSKLLGFIPITTTTWNCDQISESGYPNGVTAADGTTGALYGSDGTEAFRMGSSLRRRINNPGRLKIGFDAPYMQSACYNLSIQEFRIQRCMDDSRAVVPCGQI